METLQLFIPIITASLVLIMFGMGLTLTVADFRRLLTAPKPVLTGLLSQLLLLPAAGLAALGFLSLPAPALAGLAVVVACPGGSLSNLFSHLSRADTALSVSLTALSTVFAAITLPLWMQLALPLTGLAEEGLIFELWPTVRQVLLTTVLPVFLGMAFYRYFPQYARRLERGLRRFSIAFLLIVVGGTLFKEPAMLIDNWNTILPVALAFNLGTLGLGFAIATLAGLPRRQRQAVTLETGIQNIPLALTITTATLQSLEMGVMPSLYGACMMVTGSVLVGVFGRTGASQAPR